MAWYDDQIDMMQIDFALQIEQFWRVLMEKTSFLKLFWDSTHDWALLLLSFCQGPKWEQVMVPPRMEQLWK